MNFEYDRSKSQVNQEEHGIDFFEAQELWNDTDLLEISAKRSVELRYLVISKISQQHWSDVITYRENKIRIVSVRHSRKEEVFLYESEILR